MPGRSNPGETYMLSLLNRVLLPDHIRSRMPLRLINLISPSRSRLLELPMRGMDAEELARLGTVLTAAASRRRISRMRRIDCAPHASPAVGPRPLRQRRQRVASEFIFLSAEGAGAAAGARGPRRTARARPGRLGCNLLETARRPTSVPRRRGVPKTVAAVASFLRHADFDSILVPWRRDSINDHRATWHIVQTSLSAAMKTCRLFEYPIWAWTDDADVPSPDEVTVWRLDIKAARRAKSRATACHLSQVTDLIRMIPGAGCHESSSRASIVHGRSFSSRHRARVLSFDGSNGARVPPGRRLGSGSLRVANGQIW